jgi:hypothetical protein
MIFLTCGPGFDPIGLGLIEIAVGATPLPRASIIKLVILSASVFMASKATSQPLFVGEYMAFTITVEEGGIFTGATVSN